MPSAIASLSVYEEQKNRLGVMDFVDQEVRALHLLQSNERVRSSIASRYRLLAVDEFQDSSPIQLAIFMELADLVDEVIWVGDRKQAIYGFRGADPDLMNEVFSDQPTDEVTLTTPLQREHLRSIGSRELWVPNSDKGRDAQSDSRMVRTIAEEVTDLLRRSPQLPDGSVSHGDIAVLMRTNSQVASVVAELRTRGIRAVGSTTDLLSTREGQFVAAGLAAVVDPGDSVALAEFVTLMPDHRSHETWFVDTARITDKEPRHTHPQKWWLDPTLTSLSELAVNAAHHSWVELLLAIIDALDLPQRIKSWTTPESRLTTLDALCQIAGEYEDAAHQTRLPVTPAGLLDHLKEAATVYEQTSAHDAVLVTTMHQSKGLQWPVVVVGIPIDKDYGHREINVEKAPVFDARRPLANRSLRYLPGVLKNYAPLKQRLGVLDVVSQAQDAENRETARLLYVALTRAECHNITRTIEEDLGIGSPREAVASHGVVSFPDARIRGITRQRGRDHVRQPTHEKSRLGVHPRPSSPESLPECHANASTRDWLWPHKDDRPGRRPDACVHDHHQRVGLEYRQGPAAGSPRRGVVHR